MELSTPFYAAILGFIILGETVTILQIVGIILLIGIYLLSKKEKRSFINPTNFDRDNL